MNCRVCGSRLSKQAKFCPKCGSPVIPQMQKENKNKKPEKKTEDTQEPDMAAEPDSEDNDDNDAEDRDTRKEGYVTIINAEASSELRENKRGLYSATHVYDNNLNTPWCEDEEGLGVGAWIRVDFDREYEVTELDFYNGFMESDQLLQNNSQICNATLGFSDDSQQSVTLEKNTSLDEPVVVRLNRPVKTSGIYITIDSAYSGYKFEDTCLSELRVIAYDADAELPELIHKS